MSDADVLAPLLQVSTSLMDGGYMEAPREYFYVDEVEQILEEARKNQTLSTKASLKGKSYEEIEDSVSAQELLFLLTAKCTQGPAACVVQTQSGETLLVAASAKRYITIHQGHVQVADNEFSLKLPQGTFTGYAIVPGKGKEEEDEEETKKRPQPKVKIEEEVSEEVEEPKKKRRTTSRKKK